MTTVPPDDRSPDAVIERALVRIRRDQQSRHLQRRAPGDFTSANAARFRFLDALDASGDPLPISKVAEAIGVDRPRASRLTAELVAESLVERDQVPGDSRVTRVRLTARGRRVVDAAHANRRRSVRRALSTFTDAEAAALADLLDRFVESWPR